MPTKIIEDDYARKVMPELIGKTLIVKYWDDHDEDYVWVDCVENPELSGYVYYASLESWRIDGN